MIDKRLLIGEGAELILTKDHPSFKMVLDTVANSQQVLIATFNLSKENEELIGILKQLPKKVKVKLVTNIPGRWPRYYGEAKERARDAIRNYFLKLSVGNFKCDIEIYFNFENHAKLMITDHYGYIGSANFSKESSKNFEAGILISSKAKLREIETQFFEPIINSADRFFGGPTEILGLELLQYVKELKVISQLITEPNRRVIDEIRNDDLGHEIILHGKYMKELESILWTLEDCLTDMIHSIKMLDVTEPLRDVVLSLIKQVSGESTLLALADFNESNRIDTLFQGDPDNDGDNTDEIMQRAMENVAWEKETLHESAADELVTLTDELSQLCDDLDELAENIARLAKAEKQINNAD